MPRMSLRMTIVLAFALGAVSLAACSDDKSTGKPPTDGGEPADAGEGDADETDAASGDASLDGATDSSDAATPDGSPPDASPDGAGDAGADAKPDSAVSACPSGARSLGPLQPTTTANSGAIGTAAWTATTNARVTDDFYASIASLGSGAISNYLQVSAFGFNVPSAATITGVVVSIERNATLTSMVDQEVRLVRAGVIGGDNKAIGNVWPGTDDLATYGGSNDMWSVTLSPTDVNSAAFGVAIAAKNNNASPSSPRIDQVRVTVHYTCP